MPVKSGFLAGLADDRRARAGGRELHRHGAVLRRAARLDLHPGPYRRRQTGAGDDAVSTKATAAATGRAFPVGLSES
jgi:hypothetical protein